MLRGLDFYKRSVELAEKYRKPHQQHPAHHSDQRHAGR